MATTIEKVSQRLYLVGLPFAAKDRAKKALGMDGSNFDRDRKQWWVGCAKAAQAEAFVAELNAGPVGGDGKPADDAPGDDARVYAKVTYKGRNHFVVAESHASNRCRIVTLDGSFFAWVDMGECQLVKTYVPREYRGRQVFTTLGSIRRFAAEQKAGEAVGLEACAACGKRSARLVEDLEDGCMKCPGCCDIPSQ